MDQTERISLMEQYYNEAEAALKTFSESLKSYREVQDLLRKLAEYYAGDEWRKDFEDDESGKLPQNLKRGVLSEDGIYNLLSDNTSLQAETLSVIADIIRDGRF